MAKARVAETIQATAAGMFMRTVGRGEIRTPRIQTIAVPMAAAMAGAAIERGDRARLAQRKCHKIRPERRID